MDDEQVRIDTSGPLFERVVAALEEIRPALQQDGGDAELVEIEDEAIAIIRFSGACVGCPMSEITVRYGIEAHLRESVPEIMAVDVEPDPAVPQRNFYDVLAQASFKPL